MIICCYTAINNDWTKNQFSANLARLPHAISSAILKKVNPRDVQLAISGKLLLLEALAQMEIDRDLSTLQLDAYQRPFFDEDIDFNISHSGNMAICCATLDGKIGVDIEQVQPIDFDDYKGYFNPNEWDEILSAGDKTEAFFKFWTRKEAVLKAAGTGFYTPLLDIDVASDHVDYAGSEYYLTRLNINKGYQCYLAGTVHQVIEASQIML
ncbi:MAG: 4'-phosphopantetheinyl transferase family protein [Mucilaginibacter sp.]